MKNIPPVSTNLPVSANLQHAVEKVAVAAKKTEISQTEASILSLPKSKVSSFSGENQQPVETVLSSFLQGLSQSDSDGLNAAHAGLDASRVADLLSDD